ncbi:tetratricopeptide repeat protein [Luteolibacter flavescens]|uniref:Tetratricopeptide repeat protein n=1 Tax=Luteolibacter flavescens TaxID=1859460 RepID=A0ABT3FVN4_9BACT|nr:tetratricopeptide repeat protein [Luteolibacter flavescens]MCW1887384.1 tetratricopeptide repeat protein [Luteolibacter flavescens]
MAEISPSAPQALGVPESLATVLKWRDTPTPLSEEEFNLAIQELGTVVQALDNHPDQLGRFARALGLVVLGNLHRDHGLLDHALPFYHLALQNPADLDDGTPRGKNELANAHTNRGICTLSAGDKDELPDALADFEQAIALRKEIPAEGEENIRWGLAASLMNRGDVLHRMGERNEDARATYDEAIALLEEMDWQGNAGVLQRLALAWANRGLVGDSHEDARRCFEKCIELLPDPQNPAQLLTLCNALLNRGRHSLGVGSDTEAAAADARKVLELTTPHERDHPAPAELSLQGRHLLAHALVTWLDSSKQGPGLAEDWIGDTTDTVEDALSVQRHWEQQGFTGLRPLAGELFALGLHVYRVCQPHFFAEFLIESMDPETSPGAPFADPMFQATAARALHTVVNEVAQRAASSTLEPADVEKQKKILNSLRAADQRLAALQQKYAPPQQEEPPAEMV